MHRRFGSKSMAELLAPAINYAENGAPVHSAIAGSFADLLETFSTQSFIDTVTRNGRFPNNVR